jgi:oligopeptide/dipeptide ABC transporter ATP-binding protein
VTADQPTGSIPTVAVEGGEAVVDVRDLRVEATTGGTTRVLVDDLSFDIRRGEVRAIVGESGSGKSTVCLAVLRLLAANVRIAAGSIRFKGDDVVQMSERELRRLRGRHIGIVFQDPLSSLDPVRRVGGQLGEARRVHGLGRRRDTAAWARDMLAQLGFTDPAQSARAFPGMLSGGMRQRVCVGIAFSAQPDLVIADEPTTALDVSLQGRLLRLLLEQKDLHGTSVLLVSHDVAVVRAVADRVTVMFGGRPLEDGDAKGVLRQPASPYTRALLESLPGLGSRTTAGRLKTIPLATRPPTPGGCPFAGRCSREIEPCRQAPPPCVEVGVAQRVWCFNPEVVQ